MTDFFVFKNNMTVFLGVLMSDLQAVYCNVAANVFANTGIRSLQSNKSQWTHIWIYQKVIF